MFFDLFTKLPSAQLAMARRQIVDLQGENEDLLERIADLERRVAARDTLIEEIQAERERAQVLYDEVSTEREMLMTRIYELEAQPAPTKTPTRKRSTKPNVA